jgi:chromosome segregation ATPase
MAAILEKRLDYCEENVKNFTHQMTDVTNMMHQNEKNLEVLKNMQNTTTEELKRLRHDLRDLDTACTNNFTGVDKDISKLKESVIFQEAHTEARSIIVKNWQSILLLVISVSGFAMSIIDWWAKR